MSETKSALIVLVATLAIAPIALAWRAYALSIVWAWFIVSTFHLPALTGAQALGVSIVIAAMTYGIARDEDKDGSGRQRILRGCIRAFLTPAITIVISYPVTWFLP